MKNTFHSYSLRWYFQTTCERAKAKGVEIPDNWIKRMMGHALPGVQAHYSRAEILAMRDAYMRIYPFLVPDSSIARSQTKAEEALKLIAKALEAAKAKGSIDVEAGVVEDLKKLLGM